MTRKRFAALLFFPLALMLMGAAVLEDPEPIAVPAGMSAGDVAKAIKIGISGRGWTVAKDENGQIDAVLYIRSHVARVAIHYDTQQVRIQYVSSDNLDYKERRGKRYIHRNYFNWIHNIQMDIQRELFTIGL